MPLIPEAFAANMPVYFDDGAEWVARLPGLLDSYAGRWNLRLGEPFELSFNYVVEARRADGGEAVLKLGVPREELFTEIRALEAYAGRGAVRLLEADPEAGVMLLERVRPGGMLSRLEPGDAASRIAAGVMQRLHQTPICPEFPPLSSWCEGLPSAHRRNDPLLAQIPRELLDEAMAVYPELLASSPPPALLHGDLHHFNLLEGQHGWVAIDPKGVLGDPAYEVAPFLHNPYRVVKHWPDLKRRMRRRLEVFSETLSIPEERLRAWGLFQAALSAWWGLEDGYFDAEWLKTGLALQACEVKRGG